MKKVIVIFALTSLCVGLAATGAYAQTSGKKDIMESDLSFHIGCEVPLGEIGGKGYLKLSDGRVVQLNGAVPGISVGLQYLYGFEGTAIEGLGHNVFLSADAVWFNSCKEYRDKNRLTGDKTSMYFNVPVLLGYNYTHAFTPSFALAAQAGMGADLFLRTKSTSEGIFNYFKMSTAFAAGAQLSFIVAGQFSLGFRYAFLGNQYIRIKGVADYGDSHAAGTATAGTGNTGSAAGQDRTGRTKPFQYQGGVSTFSVRLGCHF